VAAAAEGLRAQAPFHAVIVATGVLHTAAAQPEKRLADLQLSSMEEVFRLNTFGPALVLRHFAPLLDRQRSVMALLSAKVGSIGDNRLGGWYSYRASKAALNMLVKTASIELRRTHPGAVLVALHPGTVRSALSRPFRGDEIGCEAAQAAAQMWRVLTSLEAADSGSFVAYDGQRLPW
jgi:NAD(P)-dependent dehydrogenase (short-subunit alcohol dehydrogenase family)